MRTLLLGSITLFTAIQFSGNQLASANTINRVVVFGDSLSDTGNVDDLTFGFAPGSAYYQGRFSNGPVWAERLSQRLGLNAPTPSRFNGYDYAHGGVHSGPGSTWLFFPFFSAPNAGQQIVQHLAREPARGDDLYTVWSGANDFFDGGTDINLVANNMRDHVLALANAGAQHILVANLPLLGETPEYNTGPDRAVWNQRTISYNSALATRIEAIRPTLSANIYFMDVASMLTDVIAHPS
ncbi:MAG TPA: SGNH/GDSL hydrolase family protein, partial [Tepidisphaeraceae bacterium]|nr:SGNH/GDSL hydrolase family protein [Tepidisphaeraceae bacterium]